MIFLSITGNNTIYAWRCCLFWLLQYWQRYIAESNQTEFKQDYPLKAGMLRNPVDRFLLLKYFLVQLMIAKSPMPMPMVVRENYLRDNTFYKLSVTELISVLKTFDVINCIFWSAMNLWNATKWIRILHMHLSLLDNFTSFQKFFYTASCCDLALWGRIKWINSLNGSMRPSNLPRISPIKSKQIGKFISFH
jgi:hypothetical protein